MKLIELKNYFQTIANQHNEIEHFIFAPTNHLLNLLSDSRSNINYPALTVEHPVFGLQEHSSANFTLDPNFAIIVLVKSPKDDFDKQAEDLDLVLDIILQILAKIKKDSRDRVLKCSLSNTQIEAVQPLGPDYIIGYRVELEFKNQIEFCYDATKWTI